MADKKKSSFNMVKTIVVIASLIVILSVSETSSQNVNQRSPLESSTVKQSKVQKVVSKIKEKAPDLIRKAKEKGWDKKAIKAGKKVVSKLGTGPTIGIVVGFLVVLGLAGGGYFCYSRSRSSDSEEEQTEME